MSRDDEDRAARDRSMVAFACHGLSADDHYRQAAAAAERGDFEAAETMLGSLQSGIRESAIQAVLENNLGTIAAVRGDARAARSRFARALEWDGAQGAARDNLTILAEVGRADGEPRNAVGTPVASDESPQTKVAILSLLFNWPSTGGGTVHTAETGKFLSQAGYAVRHFHAVFPEWELGRVTEPTGAVTVPLTFTAATWNADSIRDRFRAAVTAFDPDYVIITDSWNTNTLFAKADRGYPYYLRLAALECLCPLNNVRLLFDPARGVQACPRHQLATPDLCRSCVRTQGHQSGALHQAERRLAGFDRPDYSSRLRQAFAEAAGVLVVNPLIAAMIAPIARQVHVVPSGFDPERFPDPDTATQSQRDESRPTQLIFAGLVKEAMKGFHVLREACDLLWRIRQDFELVATADPPGPVSPYLRYVGWQSQADLPRVLQAADLLVFPTIAEEALGRSAVEAMAVGRPVIASRIGGLPFTVVEGLTGLLVEPGNPRDLANKIATLLDDPELRLRMGAAGRRRFEQEFTWHSMIEKHYRRLLAPRQRSVAAGAETTQGMENRGSFPPVAYR